VEIPMSAFSTPPQNPVTPKVPDTPMVFACPSCEGQFGISADMFGQQVGCPHCSTAVLVKSPDSQFETSDSEFTREIPEIDTRSSKAQSNSPKKNPSETENRSNKRWKGKKPATEEESSDLFAPGFTPQKETSNQSREKRQTAKRKKSTQVVQPTVTPVRRSTKSDVKQESEDSLGRKKNKNSKPSKSPSPEAPKSETKKKKQRFQDPPQKRSKSKSPSQSKEIVAEVVTESVKPESVKPESVKPESVKPVTENGPRTAAESQQVQLEQVPDDHVSRDQVAVVAPPSPSLTESEASKSSTDQRSNYGSDHIEADPNQPESIDHLLPPLFDVLDPTRMRGKSSEQFKVMLPDGQGGTKQVDQRVVRVEHDGEQVALVVLTPQQKQRRRAIQNVIAIIIGIVVLAAAFLLLR
jgi:DNA-directed RNA polymerase subunit RPC12/RpoP